MVRIKFILYVFDHGTAGQDVRNCVHASVSRKKRKCLICYWSQNIILFDVPTAGNSQYQTKADIVKSIMFYWANHDLLDSYELDRLERSLESPTAVPSSKGMTTEQLA